MQTSAERESMQASTKKKYITKEGDVLTLEVSRSRNDRDSDYWFCAGSGSHIVVEEEYLPDEFSMDDVNDIVSRAHPEVMDDDD
jgi:hypothetical protein